MYNRLQFRSVLHVIDLFHLIFFLAFQNFGFYWEFPFSAMVGTLHLFKDLYTLY